MAGRSCNRARQRAFHFDQSGCIGCGTCQIACKDLHDLPVGVNWRRVSTFEYGKYPRPEVLHVSMSCNHCARPACISACRSAAITKRPSDGIVILDRAKCVGCRACVEACPYGAPQFDESKRLSGKCDLCGDTLDRGQEPACVSSCMMRVLKVGWLDEILETDEPKGRGLPDPRGVGPSLRVTPRKHGEVGHVSSH